MAEKQAPAQSQVAINVNTILLTALLALSAWTLREVHLHGEGLAEMRANLVANSKATDDLSQRLTRLEHQVNSLRLRGVLPE
jgi:cell division protein FtsB